MVRALVTGGAGFVGSHLVDHLIAQGMEVIVLDDFSTGRHENLKSAQCSGHLDVIVASVLDKKELTGAMSGCDLVYHLATKSVRHSLGSPIDNHQVNSGGTLNVLEAARRQKINRFVYCSSSEVYGNTRASRLQEDSTLCEPTTIYGATKLAGEYYTKAYSRTYQLPSVIVRPFNAYGPRAHLHGESAEVIPRFVARILNGLPPIVFGSGLQTRDFTFAAEIARGIALAGSAPDAISRTINLAFGRAISILDLAQATLEVCDRLDLRPESYPPRPGDVNALAADTELAQAVLKFRPQVDLGTGLRRYLHWIKESTADPVSLLDRRVTNWTIPT